MAKPKPLFTLKRMPGLKPVEIRVFDDDGKTVKELVKFTSLYVYDHPLTFIVTPLALTELPKLDHLTAYNELCEKRDGWMENLYSMSKANPKAVRLENKKPSENAIGYWAVNKAYNEYRFSKNPDPEKLEALAAKKLEMQKLHTAELHRPVEKTKAEFHDEGKFKDMREVHNKEKEKNKAAFRYMKNKGWNEKALRKFYSKYGFN